MADWNHQLEEYNSLIKEVGDKFANGIGQFRFNRPIIIASDIAQQYFCEKKVEMQYIHGEIETEAKLTGTEAHEKLLEDTISIKREELWEEIYSKRPVFAHEMFLLARFKGSILAGRPDSIIFRNGMPLIIFEYKFGRSRRLFRNHHVQTRVYGTLLKNMGFETNNLFYVIILARPEARYDKQFKQKVVEAVAKNGPKEVGIAIENARIYITKFDQVEANRELDWAVDFWKKKRDAIPTGNPNKCKSCVYNLECDQSLTLSTT